MPFFLVCDNYPNIFTEIKRIILTLLNLLFSITLPLFYLFLYLKDPECGPGSYGQSKADQLTDFQASGFASDPDLMTLRIPIRIRNPDLMTLRIPIRIRTPDPAPWARQLRKKALFHGKHFNMFVAAW
jgi:hypothetical protein